MAAEKASEATGLARLNFGDLERKMDERIAQTQAQHEEAVAALQEMQDQQRLTEERRSADIATLQAVVQGLKNDLIEPAGQLVDDRGVSRSHAWLQQAPSPPGLGPPATLVALPNEPPGPPDLHVCHHNIH